MIRRIDIAIDCDDLGAQAEFWAGALGYRKFGEWEQYCSLVPLDDVGGPKIVLQRVPETKTVKNRVHLDLVVDDVDAEVERLEGIGASQVPGGEVSQPEIRWVLMHDPEGNEFCVCSN